MKDFTVLVVVSETVGLFDDVISAYVFGLPDSLSATCSARFPTVAWHAAYDSSYTAADRWSRSEEISSFCQSSWASGPGRLVAVAFSLLWLPRVMLHILLQGRVAQPKCTVGSWYQSSTDHYHLLWSRSHRPINPKTSISTVSLQSHGLRFTI